VNVILAVALLAQTFFGGLPIDGVTCDTSEGVLEHLHVHLQLFNRGRAVTVPAGVGIPSGAGCLYWLHTHASDGIIHIESPVVRTFTLGQFFDVWGTDLNRTAAAGVHALAGKPLSITVNGRPWNGNPRSIPLRDHEEIVIRNAPPSGTARAADWSKF